MAKYKGSMQKKSLNAPDEVRSFDKGKLELVSLGGITFGRGVFQPGWKWSDSVKPLAKTDLCEAPHLQYHVSGRIRVQNHDGTEAEYGPGDVSLLPPGHDAWVVGFEPVVVIDVQGMVHYGKPASSKPIAKKAKKTIRKAAKSRAKAKKRRR